MRRVLLLAGWFGLTATSLSTSVPARPQVPVPADDGFDACTSILVSAGATVDGSTMITYSADAPFLPKLLRHQGGPKVVGSKIDVVGWEDDRVRGLTATAAQYDTGGAVACATRRHRVKRAAGPSRRTNREKITVTSREDNCRRRACRTKTKAS